MTDIEMMKPLNHVGTKEIKTERLLLRKFTREDCEDLYVFCGNPEVVRFLSYRPHESVETVKNVLDMWVKSYENKAYYHWAIVFDNKVIGNIEAMNMEDDCFRCHFGWQLDIPYWNKGIMTEAARAVVDFLFGVVGFDRLQSGCDTRNTGSYRVMEKIGMQREALFRRYIYQKDGSIGDKYIYAIIKSDWEMNRSPRQRPRGIGSKGTPQRGGVFNQGVHNKKWTNLF